MTVTLANSSTFQLQWQFAEDDPKYGTFQGYQVLYRKISEITDEFLLSNDIKENITQTWFSVKEECELFEFKVRAYSLEGYGKLSEAVNASTPCKGKRNFLSYLGRVCDSFVITKPKEYHRPIVTEQFSSKTLQP